MNRHVCYMGNACSIHTIRWVNNFALRGWKVDLITWHLPNGMHNIDPKVSIHRIFCPPHYLARYGALIEIALLIRKIRPEIIHGHYMGHFGMLAGLYNRLTGFQPIVMSPWGTDLLHANGGTFCLVKYALKRADFIVLYGDTLRDRVTIDFGVLPEKVHILYTGLDIAKFSPENRNDNLKKELGILDSPVVISLRALQTIYDGDTLIKAIPSVLIEFPEAKFIITGKGNQERNLRTLAHSLGVADNIKFVGFIPNDEIPKYLTSADIYVSTSLEDGGFSLSSKEAMACGLPVIVTDYGENRKWVKDEVNGFVIPLRSPETLASKIIHLFRNSDQRKHMRYANRQMIKENFSLEQENMGMDGIERLYENLIERYKK
mgnify:CR=1 FL=1|jgi:L-malate glycosyltransferase